jgi:hypothetical protein
LRAGVANDFLRKINSHKKMIARDPEMFAFAPEAPKYHKCVVTKHAVMYYESTLRSLIKENFATKTQKH